ncbi:MAG TPA: neutral zinc metallopeptidase [Acidimicrobiales bacterium]|nr:neutral zinc metallopeptidase [Acidimicrobiales bacterium]
MKWRRTKSEHVDDLRGAGGGRGMGVPLAAGGGLAGIIAIIVALLVGGGGGGLGSMIDQLPGAVADGSSSEQVADEAQSDDAAFVEFLTEDVQSVWATEFQQAGRQYQYARLNMFTGQVNTGCGPATSAVGPFYCPVDAEVYIDLDFFRELTDRFGAPGDFAQAYVIAHEIGHHVQNLVGISDEVRQRQQAAGSQAEANQWSVRLELQADCLAGVWAHSVYARGDLEPGDIEEGLTAAQAVGDDRIQEQAGMSVNPETWTHGSASDRQEWFDRGFESGESTECDTFG